MGNEFRYVLRKSECLPGLQAHTAANTRERQPYLGCLECGGQWRRDYFPVVGDGSISKYRKVPQLHEDDSGEVQNLEEKGDSGDPLPRRGHPATESQKFSRRM